jgi:hypothetical protein
MKWILILICCSLGLKSGLFSNLIGQKWGYTECLLQSDEKCDREITAMIFFNSAEKISIVFNSDSKKDSISYELSSLEQEDYMFKAKLKKNYGNKKDGYIYGLSEGDSLLIFLSYHSYELSRDIRHNELWMAFSRLELDNISK